MHFTELFIRRPVLSTVLGAFILLLGFQGIFNLAVRQYPEVEETVVTITTIYPGAPPDLIQGFITAPIAEAVATTENIDYVTSPEHAVGQRRQRQHAARRRPRRGADRGAVQGAAGARPAARRRRGPGDRQGHRLRFRADVPRRAQPEHDPGAAHRVPRAGDPAAHVDDRGRRRDRDHRRRQLRHAGLDRPAAARRARRDRRRGAGGDPRVELPLGAGQDRERVRRLQHHTCSRRCRRRRPSARCR